MILFPVLKNLKPKWRNAIMEEKLDELIALTKLQNNAWEHCLNMLNEI